jgi:transposase
MKRLKNKWTSEKYDEVRRLIKDRYTRAEIAQRLGVSKHSVRACVGHLRERGLLPQTKRAWVAPRLPREPRENYSAIARKWARALNGRRFNNSVEGR